MHAKTKRLHAKIRAALARGCCVHPEGLTVTEVAALGHCNAHPQLQLLIADGEVERRLLMRKGLVARKPQYLYRLTTKGANILREENADE